MIGILLELQVNNWNEERKKGILQTKLLQDMVENLESNIRALEKMLERNRRDNQSSEIIISVIENRTTYNDSLDYHFG